MPIASPSTAAISGFSNSASRADEPPCRKVAASRATRDGEKIADVVAGGEHAALAAHDERADLGIALGLVERLDQRFVHRAGDRVLLLRPGEGRRHDRAVAADLDVSRHGVLGHALSARIAS